jgi:glucuronate isomerase
MAQFLTEDFLLDTEFARRLYHDYAKDEPIFDYHCHLPPELIAQDYQFKNMYDVWAERRSLQMARDAYQWCA